MAARGASLSTIRDYCNENGIPGRRNALWSTNTWFFILQPSSVLKYCGMEVYNVHDKHGRERSHDEWVTVEGAHEALISEEEARSILATRQSNKVKCFDRQSRDSRRSDYMLTGGLFVCGRCGANMVGYVNSDGKRYRCGSHAHGKAFSCGPAVMARQPELEVEVIEGLRDWLGECADPKGFARLVNEEYRTIWESASGHDPRLTLRQAEIDRKIENLRAAFERGLDEDELQWTQQRIRELKTERDTLNVQSIPISKPLHIDMQRALSKRKQLDAVLVAGTVEEKKALFREGVEKIILHPDELRVEIRYQIPGFPFEAMNLGTYSTEVHCNRFSSGGSLWHLCPQAIQWVERDFYLSRNGRRHVRCGK